MEYSSQWGYSGTPATYPIAFTKVLCVLGLTFDSESTQAPNVEQSAITNTDFRWYRYTGVGTYKVTWLAIGI